MNFLFSIVRRDAGSSSRATRKDASSPSRKTEKRMRDLVDSIGRMEDRA